MTGVGSSPVTAAAKELRFPGVQWLGLLPLTCPWLNPFASGPSPAVSSWLGAMACLSVWLVVAACVPMRLPRTAAGSWLLAAVLSAVIGLLQYFGATFVFGQWVNSTTIGEAFGNLRQRNQFATLMNMGLLASMTWAAPLHQSFAQVQSAALETTSNEHTSHAQVPKFLGIRADVWVIVCAALLAAGNAASSSRTGLLQLLLVAALMWVWGGLRQPLIRRTMLTAAFTYAVASIALPLLAGLSLGGSGILGRFNETSPGCGSRLLLWRNVLHLIAIKPWLGWGWGELDFAHFVTLYPGARFCDILDNAHNLPLHLAVELGVPAALAICGGGLWLVWRAKPWREQDATRQMAWGVLAVILLHSLLEYPLWYGPFQIAFGLCVALLWRTPPSTFFDKKRPVVPVIIGLSASVLIAFISYASWDYYRVSQIYRIPKMRDAAYQDNTLEKIQGSWLFKNQVDFARLTIMPLTPGNLDSAETINRLARDLLHFSPEAKVAIKLIESAVILGRDDEALFYLLRFKAAFPDEHARWVLKNSPTSPHASPAP